MIVLLDRLAQGDPQLKVLVALVVLGVAAGAGASANARGSLEAQ